MREGGNTSHWHCAGPQSAHASQDKSSGDDERLIGYLRPENPALVLESHAPELFLSMMTPLVQGHLSKVCGAVLEGRRDSPKALA